MTTTAAELARSLRVNAKSLRAVIRKERLVPGKTPGRYALDESDVRRISSHPKVRELPRHETLS